MLEQRRYHLRIRCPGRLHDSSRLRRLRERRRGNRGPARVLHQDRPPCAVAATFRRGTTNRMIRASLSIKAIPSSSSAKSTPLTSLSSEIHGRAGTKSAPPCSRAPIRPLDIALSRSGLTGTWRRCASKYHPMPRGSFGFARTTPITRRSPVLTIPISQSRFRAGDSLRSFPCSLSARRST